MATSAFGVGDFTAAYRQAILPYIQDNVPTQVKLLKVLKTNDNTRFFNNNFYAPIRSNKHGGVTNLANDKAKVVTGNSPTLQASVQPKYLTGTFDISDAVAKASASDKGAVEAAMTFQMKTLTADFSKNVNRQYHSDGVGVIAEVQGSTSGSVVVIQYPTNSTSGTVDTRTTPYYGAINYDIPPAFYLAPGQIIGMGSAGGTVGTISSVTGGTALGTVTFTGTLSSAAGNPLYILDGDANAAGTTEIQGIRAALSEGTPNYAGLARGATQVWQPQYMGTTANQALTINNMEIMYMQAYRYAREGDRYAWFCNLSLYTKFGDLLTALRRTINKVDLTSGWSGLAFDAGQGDVPVILDFDTPDGDMVLMNLDTWTVTEIAPMGFIEDNNLRRADYITFQKIFSWYTNLLCLAPAANGRMVRQTK